MLNTSRKLSVTYRMFIKHVNNSRFGMLNQAGSNERGGQESAAASAGAVLPAPYPSAFEIFSAVRFKWDKNLISCFILHNDSTAVRARAASTSPLEFHTGTAIPMVPRIASPSLVA